MFLLCPEKPGSLGQVRVIRLCLEKCCKSLKWTKVKEFCQLYKISGATRPPRLSETTKGRRSLRMARDGGQERYPYSMFTRLRRRQRRPGFIFFMQSKSPLGI